MKVALVCIAKNEDNYIQEWIDYNKKLGFDNIFIYQNNWRCVIDDPTVIKIDFDGHNKQIPSYNHFIKHNLNKYDWAAFLDIDEFLVLKKHNNIKEFINDYSDYKAIGINWVLFGDNGHNGVDDDYSVLKRFTRRQSSINPHIKSIIKLTPDVIMNVHNPNCLWTDTNRKTNRGPFNELGDIDIAVIHHYFCKTKEEFLLKCERGRADTTIKRSLNEFDSHNFNEIEDLTAYNFMYNDNYNLLNTQR